jgi:Cu-Zn family superoxide dismutase
MKKSILFTFIFLFFASYVFADEIVIHMQLVNEQGVGKNIGVVTATDSQYGLILIPQLGDLPLGIHGFHIHQNPDCSNVVQGSKPGAGFAAGGHFDPLKADKHEGPYGEGHLGDLPALYVGADGKASLPLLAPRLKVADIKGRSLMIHAGGDNYSDLPVKLGGGGARIACGVISQ